MAFDVGGGGKAKVRPSMNVTPLVDVVLVLLIIFMVVTPLMMKQFWAHVPKKDENKEATPPPEDPTPPVIVGVKKDGSIVINKEPVADGELAEKLRRILAARSDHMMFFTAEPDVPYGRAMEVLDLARGGGASTIAVITEQLQL